MNTQSWMNGWMKVYIIHMAHKNLAQCQIHTAHRSTLSQAKAITAQSTPELCNICLVYLKYWFLIGSNQTMHIQHHTDSSDHMIQQVLNKLTELTLLPEWWAKPHVSVLKDTNSPTTTHMGYYTSMCWSTQTVQQLPTQSTTCQCTEVHKQSSNYHTKYHTSVCWSTQAVQQPTQSTTCQRAEVHKQSNNPHKVPHVNVLKYTVQ